MSWAKWQTSPHDGQRWRRAIRIHILRIQIQVLAPQVSMWPSTLPPEPDWALTSLSTACAVVIFLAVPIAAQLAFPRLPTMLSTIRQKTGRLSFLPLQQSSHQHRQVGKSWLGCWHDLHGKDNDGCTCHAKMSKWRVWFRSEGTGPYRHLWCQYSEMNTNGLSLVYISNSCSERGTSWASCTHLASCLRTPLLRCSSPVSKVNNLFLIYLGVWGKCHSQFSSVSLNRIIIFFPPLFYIIL